MNAIGTRRLRANGKAGACEPGTQPCDSLRQVILIRGEGGCWIAECPSLPGCTGEGRSREAAIASVREAIANYLAELLACDLPVPEERFDALILAV
jgi:predicted RNase H-like HicB family nuclease